MSGPLNKLQSIFGSIGRKNVSSPKDNDESEHHAKSLLHPTGQCAPQLSPSRVRIVVFKDCKGVKQPLFDSQLNCDTDKEENSTKSLCDMRSIERLEESSSSATNSVPAISNCSGWAGSSVKNKRAGFVKRPSTDSELLGEMIFGSMPMKTIGSSVKIHYIRSTDQLMLTKTFSACPKLLQQCSLTDYSDCCPLPGDVSSQTIERSCVPVPKNHSMFNNLRLSLSPDSGRKIRSSSLSVPILRPASALSTHSSPLTYSPPSPSPSLSVTGSVSSSFTRRIQRYRATSLENPGELYRKVLKPLDKPPHSRKKFGIGVILCLNELSEPDIQHFQNFLFSHFTLIDIHLEKIKDSISESAKNQGPQFIRNLSKAYEEFLKDFLSLYQAPRIESPVWLSLVGQVSQRNQVCSQLMKEFASCIVEMETKEKKFFLSSLLTAVLSHHLAWVFTESQHSTDSRFNKMMPKSFGVLAESHPYNPLWAQLGDLFGAVSYPLKLSRTVVTGKNSSAVCRLLYILTYFIRCSEVESWKPKDSYQKVSPKASKRIPVPNGRGFASSREHENHSNESSHSELVSRLDDDYILESRASSITVVADRETPFASPISFDRDTPVVKPHPFSIRQTSRQRSVSSDAVSSFGTKSNVSAATKSPNRSLKSKHSGSISSYTSERSGSRSSLKHNLQFQHTCASNTAEETQCNQTCDLKTSHSRHQQAPGMASCTTKGFCPITDDFVSFDPNEKYRSHMSPSLIKSSPQGPFNYNYESSLHVRAPHVQLGQSPIQHNMLHKNNSTTSMDSGYDRSLTASSTTEYSRDSYAPSYMSDFSRDSCTQNVSFISNDSHKVTAMDVNKTYSPSHQYFKPHARPRSDAISFASHQESRNYELPGMRCIGGSCSTIQQQSPESCHYGDSSPDLPSPTQPLLPTKVSKLIQNDETYTSTIRKKSGNILQSQKVPLVRVQQPTIAHDEEDSDHETSIDQVSTGISLRRQAALLSESDSLDSSDKSCGTILPTQSLSFISSISESISEDTIDSEITRAQSPGMVSSDSGRGTKSFGTGDCLQQDLEDISVVSDNFDSDDAFCSNTDFNRSQRDLLSADDELDVEKSLSLSPSTLRMLRQSPSILQQKLQAHDRLLSGDGPIEAPEQFSDFEDVVLPDVDEFHLDNPHDHLSSLHPQNLDDFGHSLFVGLSPTYLSDFVLHGTTQSADQQFEDKVFKDLNNCVKHSIIDEPIEHCVAIVADTDSWTVKVLSTSRSLQTSDVIMGSAVMQPSAYVKQTLSAVKNMHEMQLPANFCLSHLEDRLLQLNEQSITLANTLLEYGSDTDFVEILPCSLDSLGVHDHYDRLLLIVLAGVNCPDQDIKARLDYIFMTNLLGKQYF